VSRDRSWRIEVRQTERGAGDLPDDLGVQLGFPDGDEFIGAPKRIEDAVLYMRGTGGPSPVMNPPPME
jgi:hypothetical protein